MKKKLESEILLILNSEGKPTLIKREQVLRQNKIVRKSRGGRENECLCIYVYMHLCTHVHKSFQSPLGITQLTQFLKYIVVCRRLSDYAQNKHIQLSLRNLVESFLISGQIFPEKEAVSQQGFPHFILNLSINRLAKTRREICLCCIRCNVEAGLGS